MPIGQRFIAQRPQPLAWLQFWRVGWQEQQVQAIRHYDLTAEMPAGLIDNQHNLLVWPTADCRGELGQGRTPDVAGNRRQQQPERLATLRTDKAVEIGPFVAMLHCDNRALTFLAPHAANDRLEANPMLIFTPDLDRRLGVRRLQVRYSLGESLFLKLS
jgi:hypothetical protein